MADDGLADNDSMEARMASARSSGAVFFGSDKEDAGLLPVLTSEEEYLGRHPMKEPETFALDMDAIHCLACGVNFQAQDEVKPGFIPG